MKKSFCLVLIIISVLTINFISAGLETGVDGIIGIDLIPPIPNSIFNDAFFNGGWMDGGVSIIDGDIYAQTGYFYNISALDVTELHVNGSISPLVGYDNVFDLGNSSMRWRNLYLGGQVYSNGTGDNWFLGDVCIGCDSADAELHIKDTTNGVELRVQGHATNQLRFSSSSAGNNIITAVGST